MKRVNKDRFVNIVNKTGLYLNIPYCKEKIPEEFQKICDMDDQDKVVILPYWSKKIDDKIDRSRQEFIPKQLSSHGWLIDGQHTFHYGNAPGKDGGRKITLHGREFNEDQIKNAYKLQLGLTDDPKHPAKNFVVLMFLPPLKVLQYVGRSTSCCEVGDENRKLSIEFLRKHFEVIKCES